MTRRSINIILDFSGAFFALIVAASVILTLTTFVSDFEDFRGLPFYIWVGVLLAIMLLSGGYAFFGELSKIRVEYQSTFQAIEDELDTKIETLLISYIELGKMGLQGPARNNGGVTGPADESVASARNASEAALEVKRDHIRDLPTDAKRVLKNMRGKNLRKGGLKHNDDFDAAWVTQILEDNDICTVNRVGQDEYEVKVTDEYWPLLRGEWKNLLS